MTRWLRTLRAEIPVLARLPDQGWRPRPAVQVDLGPAVPWWALRALAAVATATLATICLQRAGVGAWLGWTIVVVATALMAVRPSTLVAQTTLVVSGLLFALAGSGPFDPVVFVLIPLGYTAHELAWWAERTAWTCRVELRALAAGHGRGLVLVAGAAALGVVMWLAPRPSAALVVAGGVALVVLTWLVVGNRADRV